MCLEKYCTVSYNAAQRYVFICFMVDLHCFPVYLTEEEVMLLLPVYPSNNQRSPPYHYWERASMVLRSPDRQLLWRLREVVRFLVNNAVNLLTFVV